MNSLRQGIYAAVLAQAKMHNMRDTILSLIDLVTLESHAHRFFEKDSRFAVHDIAPAAREFKTQLTTLASFRGLVKVIYLFEDGSVQEFEKLNSLTEYVKNNKCDLGYGVPVVTYTMGVLQGRAPMNISKVYIQYMSLPDITADGYNSWIAELYPSVIIEEVLYRLKANTGDNSIRGHMSAGQLARVRLYGETVVLHLMGA